MSQLLEAEVRFLCTVSTFSSRWGSKNAFLCCTLVSNNSETHIPDMFVINMVPTFITHTHTYPCCLNVHACTNTLIIHTLWCTHCCSFTLTAHTLNTSLILAQIHKSAYHTDTKKYMPHNAHKLPLSCKHVLLSYSAVATRTPYFSLFLPR